MAEVNAHPEDRRGKKSALREGRACHGGLSGESTVARKTAFLQIPKKEISGDEKLVKTKISRSLNPA